MLAKWCMILACRIKQQARISVLASLKGYARIRIGRQVTVHHFAQIDASRGEVVLGDSVTLNRFAYVIGGRAGVRLGRHVEINNFSVINGMGGVVIGDDTLIGPGVKIISYHHLHELGMPIRMQPSEPRPISIGKDVWIGANAVIVGGVNIGEGVVVAAGAVVTRDVPSGSIVAGVPARLLRQR